MKKLTLIVLLFIFSCNCHSDVDLVLVDKSDQKMYLIKDNIPIKEYKVALGAKPKGHKEKEGDEKTPEGQYKLDFIKEDSDYYRAMHISYPNKADKENAERKGFSPGGSIMVHGQRNYFGFFSFITQHFNWTNGCIALSNSEMDEFLELVEVDTPIHIKW